LRDLRVWILGSASRPQDDGAARTVRQPKTPNAMALPRGGNLTLGTRSERPSWVVSGHWPFAPKQTRRFRPDTVVPATKVDA
jgi:hypothetical protein